MGMAHGHVVTVRTIPVPGTRLVIDVADGAARLRDAVAGEEEWTPATAAPRVVAVRTHRDIARARRRATTTAFGTGTPTTVAGVTGRTRLRHARWPVEWVADTFWYVVVAGDVSDVAIYG